MENDVVSQAIEHRLANFRQKTRVQAGSLITSVFGDAILPRGGRVWLGSLIRLLQPLELSERLVRTAVFRLVKDEWLETQALGRRTDYMLTPSGRRRFDEAAKQIYAAEIPAWDRRWRLLMVVGAQEPRWREPLRRALFWQGFGETGSGCFVHPSADLGTAMDALASEGLQELLPKLIPLIAVSSQSMQSATDLDLVRNAWNLEELGASYATFLDRYAPILEALLAVGASEVQEESAFLVRTLLIHDVRKLLLRDPQLPEGLLPPAWPGSKARQLCKEIYRRLLAASERHLDAHLRLSNGDPPRATAVLASRFESASLLETALPLPRPPDMPADA